MTRYGTQQPVGLYHSTCLAELDFETYSEAGMCWTGEKWVGPPGAPKNSKGLPVVGVVNYTQHPSFEVLVMKYDLKDGAGPRTWRPGEPNPQPLFDHIARGLLLEAHSAGFERRVWQACERLYGWPPMPFRQWRCSAAKSRAWGRPGGLDAAAAVAGTARKDPAGDSLIRALTMPRKPTNGDPSFRLTRESAPEKFAALDAYCEQDIRAEAELSAATPDLPPAELEYWQVDQAINERGVAVDVPLIEAGIKIVNAAHERYGEEVKRLTGGIAASEVAQLTRWCAGAGYPMESMDEDAISAAVADPACPPLVRQVLDLRAKIASASVKKLFAMRNTVSKAGRIHDLFIFHGARTGRCTGEGPQPTNFPKAGPNVWRCKCGRHYGESRPACPWCGAGPEARVDHKGLPATSSSEWSPEAMNDAIEVVRTGDLGMLELFFGEALLTIAGCLRGTFIAAPGHDLISSDWTAIEAVVLACLAGEQWRVDLFRQGGKIYEASGAKVGGVPYEDLLEHKKRTGQHHPLRQVGKTCFTADTQVLTDSGIKAIVDVLSTDKVWDGEEWVSHSGVLHQGVRGVVGLDGARMTPDHKISTGRSWQEARKLVSSERTRYLSYSHGLGHLPPSGLTSETRAALKPWLSSATAVLRRIALTSQISLRAGQDSAIRALKNRQRSLGKTTGSTPISFPTWGTAVAYSTGSLRQSADAIARLTKRGRTTAAGALRSATSGASRLKAGAGSYATSSRFRGGMTPPWVLTASKRTGTTSPATFGSLRRKKIKVTSGKFRNSNVKSTSYEHVYDLVNAGPRRRFTILTDVGPLIASNCELALGYGGWVGSWRAFDPTDALTDDDVKKIILAWRKSSPEIVEFWGGQTRRRGYDLVEDYFGVEGMFIQAILNPGVEFDCRGIKFQMVGDCMYMTLLSGRRIAYHTPRLHPSDRYGSRYSISYWGWNTNPKNGPRGWIQIRTHGGKLVENLCQAVSNDLLRFASVNLERAGYAITLHVYDEIVTEVPQGQGSVEELEAWMRYTPDWAKGWPVGAAGGWRADRYRKG